MITVRRSEDRGKGKIDWLDSRFSFSFGDYYDPAFESFGPLRVINEDWIKGGAGFPPHPHRDMEIVTYILEGAIAHKDSTGGGGTIRPGEIQRMSAGSGIVHAEFNASPTEICHLLQIWIMPSKTGIAPGYEQKTISPEVVQNHFGRIAAPEPRENEVRLVQDAEIWVAKLDAGSSDAGCCTETNSVRQSGVNQGPETSEPLGARKKCRVVARPGPVVSAAQIPSPMPNFTNASP